MKKILLLTVILSTWGITSIAQQVDTTNIYKDRTDSLKATVFTGRSRSNYLSKAKDLRTEVTSAAGLMKMACCNLAESFENSASVTVGYSDATTGARQIRLLGLSGAYTQMLDENRPVMRGITAPYGLSYTPGPWLESIQVGKGSPSVVNGTESITGSINLEHRKPTDGKPLFLNASVMNDTKTDFNVASSLQVSDNLYTVLMGHVDGNFKTYDMNGDGFADEPALFQVNAANRWLWYTPAVQVRWGVRFIADRRQGGQMSGPWKSDVNNNVANAYFKIGHSLKDDGASSIALVGDYTLQKTGSSFGANLFDATEHSVFANFIFRDQFSESHDLTAGINTTVDYVAEDITGGGQVLKGNHQTLSQVAPYAEYTFRNGETLSMIAGFSGTILPGKGFYPAPRLTFKYQPSESVVLRANGGRGVRFSQPVADNIGILSTGKRIIGDLTDRPVEDAWTYGGNATLYFGDSGYLSLDYFQSDFSSALLLDREAPDQILFYSLDGHRAYSRNIQADISFEPLRKLTLTLTGRYTDAKAWQPSGAVRELPLTSRYKAVLNAQYTIGANRWILDFTASMNGSARVYDFMRELKDEDGHLLYPEGRTPSYPLIYAQVTRRFRGFDVYIGGENLTGSMQMHPVIGADNPFSDTFDAASIWGPIMGAKFYAGFRMTIWK
ncbi:MAG: TonB-dependent receptor plug domain-containing protein [Bacteroidales bacterium]|nr:TonB-dependent receptor plug domain-containing protein [Bacteroidales bacterium]